MTDAMLAGHRERLQAGLRMHARLLVAYSGGVDSAYLAWEAYQVLGERMLAVLADSPSLSRRHLHEAMRFADDHHIPLRVVQTEEMQQAAYVRNDAARCFHCKDELFRVMRGVAAEAGVPLAYGRNRDDDGEYRPGQKAAAIHGAVAPLAEAGLGKAEVRALARAAGLEVWDKPASACLSSRIEHGRAVTVEALRRVEKAEEWMAELGFRQVRVRHHGELGRVEIERGELEQAMSVEMFAQISAGLHAAGFTYVALDVDGYRAGSMNALIPAESLLAPSLPTQDVAHAS